MNNLRWQFSVRQVVRRSSWQITVTPADRLQGLGRAGAQPCTLGACLGAPRSSALWEPRRVPASGTASLREHEEESCGTQLATLVPLPRVTDWARHAGCDRPVHAGPRAWARPVRHHAPGCPEGDRHGVCVQVDRQAEAAVRPRTGCCRSSEFADGPRAAACPNLMAAVHCCVLL